jgi:ligand-binding sensor domain-containing protein/signal transduction histidine kinase
MVDSILSTILKELEGRPRLRLKNRWSLLALGGAAFLHLLHPGRGFALDPAKDVLQYNCQTWSRQNGLPVNGINAITQTKDGYLWLGTAVGLVRFDGVEFKLLDLARVRQLRNTIVTSLAGAKDGGLWVGLENSAFGLYDGQSFSFRGKDAWGQLDMNVRSILESKDGTLWLTAERQASRLTRAGAYEEVMGSSTNYTVNILCGYEDSKGRHWFGTANQGVHYWQDGKVTKLADSALEGDLVYSVTEDSDGQIWIGTRQRLHCYDSNLQRKEIPLLAEEIHALFADRHGVLWIGTKGHGLVRYQNGTFSFLRKIDGLASDYVKTVTEDHEGSLWIGTRDGVSQLTDVKFPTQPAAEDPSVTDALAVGASRRGGIWVGSTLGVTYFDGKAKTYGTEAGLTDPYIKRVFEASNGDLYLVSGNTRLVVFSGDKAVATYSASNMVVGMAEDAHGVVVSVAGSLYRAGTNYFTPYTYTNGEPALGWVLNLASGRDDSIWVACGAGIFRVKDGVFQQWAAAQGLSNTVVQGICEDSEGVVWGATMTGIVRLKDNHVRCINRENGLFDDNVYSIVPDNFGNLWVDSGRGIFRVSRRSMNDFADGKASHVDCVAYDGPESVKPTDKIASQERVACKTTDGRIWFPSAKGVVVIDPAHVSTNQIAPPVHIERVRANGTEVVRIKSMVVPPGKGELEFHFNALSFIASQKVRFRYRLEGYDKDWVEMKDRRVAFYTNLKPDRYTFRVIAANADGVWNTTGDFLEVRLLPHFYQTAWARSMGGGLVLAVLASVYLWRVRHLKRKQQALQRARDLLETEVRNRTAELAKANGLLHHEVEDHERTEVQLNQRTRSLENEIEERKRMQLEVERVHRELLETSRQAGMAEVATSVLHNVGNVLNSVNVGSSCLAESLRKSKAVNLSKVVALLREREADLGVFITNDPKGKQLPGYLAQLAEHLADEQAAALKELSQLQKNIEHIKDIVSMQQSFAKVSGATETVDAADLMEDTLRMNASSLVRHDIQVIREFGDVPPLSVEKHKVLQILVNLVRNAKHACDESGRADKRLTLCIANGNGSIKMSVIDNGIGISPENRINIFAHGFTTKTDGHGFGLHSGALAAKEMGGSLAVLSDGPGKGATFILELPLDREQRQPMNKQTR